jgi:hypothetical protein
MFVIEDELHVEWHGQFGSFDDALIELKRMATIPWDEAPNVAPCSSWESCRRDFAIVEFDESQTPWRKLRRVPVYSISAAGLNWANSIDQRT